MAMSVRIVLRDGDEKTYPNAEYAYDSVDGMFHVYSEIREEDERGRETKTFIATFRSGDVSSCECIEEEATNS